VLKTTELAWLQWSRSKSSMEEACVSEEVQPA
jgi:hypothetical protein